MVLAHSSWLYLGPGLVGERVTIHRCAWIEPMEPSIVDRPEGTGDVLLMYYHDPVVIDHQRHPAGSLRCWPDGAGHRYGDLEREWRHSWIHCSGMLADRLAECLSGVLTPAEPEPVERHLRQLMRSAAVDRDPELAELALRGLLRCLERERDDADEIPPEWLELRRWLEQHAHEDHPLEAIAARVGLAKSRFCERFKATFGSPPLAFVQELRLDRARWLLRDRNRRIADVAHEVGYADVGYFGRLVRRRYGASPSALRGG